MVPKKFGLKIVVDKNESFHQFLELYVKTAERFVEEKTYVFQAFLLREAVVPSLDIIFLINLLIWRQN